MTLPFVSRNPSDIAHPPYLAMSSRRSDPTLADRPRSDLLSEGSLAGKVSFKWSSPLHILPYHAFTGLTSNTSLGTPGESTHPTTPWSLISSSKTPGLILLSPLSVSDPTPLPSAQYLPYSPKCTSLRYIFWCCNGLDGYKIDVVVGVVTTEAPDLVVLTNVCIAHSLFIGKINTLINRLQKATGLAWNGLSSPNSHACLGGTILLHSSRISNPIVDHLLPFGALTSFSGSWDNSDFTILSIQWNVDDDEPRHSSMAAHRLWREQMLWGLINDFTKDGPTVLCGAFGQSAGDLDRRLLSDTLLVRRIPFRGPQLTEVYEKSSPQFSRGLDHIVSNLMVGITRIGPFPSAWTSAAPAAHSLNFDHRILHCPLCADCPIPPIMPSLPLR